ncbi:MULTISPECIES: hypothetical protein [unclassified Agrobacterium]|uniref:hypothetical protein n=1 Tax=unclassified Agrobacterium TaxID=2632611 RepID=UPI00244BAE61|nr:MULTISPECIES: hypothetical protein [unclassified Agrobacterium]MDH0614127.1 hypothetical protein [Agrobacterium sp. GD03872]MDH0695578.1 hypothetical protein [Agrobacterium sp. GD03871]MDH1058480.1 hypothetical protein [Agrobacterium sp. GD03992]MDH2209578.1 hypothetical protein [Agrobacterium sp. GD03643]MDH2218982.1 hypothetical protein [Agrobacterium sp. GD03638]
MARGTGKSGVEIAQEHVDSLIEYLERQKDKPLPRYGVDLNKSAIAKECGFDRQVFRTNPRCSEILEKADEEDRKAYLTRLENAEAVREQKARTDADQMALEDQNLRLLAENASLRRELDRLKRLSAVIAETGRLP